MEGNLLSLKPTSLNVNLTEKHPELSLTEYLGTVAQSS